MVVICINKLPNLTVGKKYSVIKIDNETSYSYPSIVYAVKDDNGLISVFSEKYVKDVSEMREDKIKMLGI
jgi:hypothetical protein